MRISLLAKSIWTLFLLCCCVVLATAQNSRTVTGTVIEAPSNEAIPGASIREKGTTNGTITGLDGEFSLQLTTENPVLIITFIGYATQEIPVGNSNVVNITLESELSHLDEVVVMGYGEQKKESITSAVSTVQSKDIAKVAAPTVSATLAGKLPGVAFRQAEGRPGSGAMINIRNMGNPLFVIDGIQKDQGQFNNISPQDIESITVLKDAAASVYGSRAANGVIIVTTKRGARGQKPT